LNTVGRLSFCRNAGHALDLRVTLTRPIAALLLGVMAGCASTDPRSDYERAAQMIADRTGVQQVYRPDAAGCADEQVNELLDGGLAANEAVQVALLNNRALQAAFEEIGVSRAEVVESGLLSNPMLGLGLRFPEGGGRANFTLALAQELVDLWQIPVRKRVAEWQLERTILLVARQAVALASETQVRYWRLLALQHADALGREDVELARRSVELARERFDAGEAGKLDVNLAQAALFETEQRLITLRRELQGARADLARVLGVVRSDRSWELSDNLPAAAEEELDEDALLEGALTHRLDAQAAIMQVHAAEAEVRRQVLDLFPNVTIGTEWERTESRALPGRKILADSARASVRSGQLTVPDIQTRGERRFEHSQIIDSLLGPTLEVTLPLWHQNQPQIARARYQAAQRRRELEDLLDQIAQDVHTAVATARGAAEAVGFVRDQALPLAQENVEAARRAYRAGEESIVTLMEAQRGLVAQRREYVNARRDWAIALAELQRDATMKSQTMDAVKLSAVIALSILLGGCTSQALSGATAFQDVLAFIEDFARQVLAALLL
jgi:cobalt-zinc-cadmium efflux system outer membrane protein